MLAVDEEIKIKSSFPRLIPLRVSRVSNVHLRGPLMLMVKQRNCEYQLFKSFGLTRRWLNPVLPIARRIFLPLEHHAGNYIYFLEDSQGCQNRGELPPDLFPGGGEARGQYCPLHSRTIVTKQNTCLVTYKCVCISVSQIHNIKLNSLWKHGKRRAKTVWERGRAGRICSNVQNKVFSKKVFTKIFPFSHKISVKKGLHFQICRNTFKICRLCSRFVWITTKCVCVGGVAPCPILLRLCTEGIRSVVSLLLCSY